jgi:hypothetical protein
MATTVVQMTQAKSEPPKETGTLAKALIAASREFKPVVKDSKNPHFGNAYASLGAYIDATKPALIAHGLAVVQRSLLVGEDVCLETLILHESGETMQAGLYPLRPVKPDPQGFGSAMTYARRYCYAAALNLASEDDDGSGASAPGKKAKTEPEPPKRTLSAESEAKIMAAAKAQYHGKGISSKRVMAHLDSVARGLGADGLATLPEDRVDPLIDLIVNGGLPE